jgi:hypothetical protein
MADNAGTFAFADLVGGWRDAREWQHAHPDLAGFYAQRYVALAKAFNADLHVPPPKAPAFPKWLLERHAAVSGGVPPFEDVVWWSDWHRPLHDLALHLEDLFRQLDSPFSRYLEAPWVIGAARDCFGDDVSRPLIAAQAAVSHTASELLAALYPDAATQTVSAADLRANGYDFDSPAPDPLDYW